MHLAEIERGHPGCGDVLMEMALAEQRHRHRTDLLEIAYTYAGLALGAAVLAGCIVGAAYLGMHGHEALAFGLLGVPVLGAAGWLINARIGERGRPEKT
jgi:uncharacterized membrane protein